MCRNHSHLIARYVGEDTSGLVPVLTFALASTELTIEGPFPGGTKLIVPTSGMLHLPSWSLDGSFQSHLPQTGVQFMSLCFIPGDAATIMQEVMSEHLLSSIQSGTTPVTSGASLIAAIGATDEEDAPF